MDKQILDDYTKALLTQYEQYYTGLEMHPEEGRNIKINDELLNIQKDIQQIDNTLMNTGVQVYKLMTNTILRLNNIHANIMTEKERFQDMQMLCNKYNDYDNVKILDNTYFKGDFVYDQETTTFIPYRQSANAVALTVLDVTGNGYEGNKYVYKDYMYTNKVVDTSRRKNLVDNSTTSYYEYSRITISDSEDVTNEDFNKDNKEALCTISFQAASGINEIEIKTDESSMEIVKVAYSIDGIEYEEMSIPYIAINNKLASYENYGYIYGSGQIVFPYKVQFFKITFASNGYQDEQIAYDKKFLIENSNKEETYETSYMPELESSEVTMTTIVNSARRHVIRISEIRAFVYQYSPKTQIYTCDLLGQQVHAVSLFANVYVPEGLNDDAVKFILTVNGQDHDVVPINSHANGVKVIRFSTGNINSPYTVRTGEKIKSAKLTVIFTNTTYLAPRINNVKLLIGGEL